MINVNELTAELAEQLPVSPTENCSKEDIARVILSLREAFCEDETFLIDETPDEVPPALQKFHPTERDLDFHATSVPVANGIAAFVAKCAMPPDYNDFSAQDLVELLEKLERTEGCEQVQVLFGREGSVVIYFDFGKNACPKWSEGQLAFHRSCEPDEMDADVYRSGLPQNHMVWRLWWD